MSHVFFQVDAFTDVLFKGNPAAVMKLDEFLPEEVMQSIAAENNLAETAFVVPNGDHYKLRWFTPEVEIDFCGHATVASAHILKTEYDLTPPFDFDTKVGRLSVGFEAGLYVLDAPITPAVPTPVTKDMQAAFDAKIVDAFWGAKNLCLVFEAAEDIRSAAPDMRALVALAEFGVSISAPGDGAYDCVSRYFAPAAGIDEDPVTGSAHAAIGPYWAARLGKTKLTAYQASSRGGILHLDVGKDRLTIAGHAVTYMKGEILPCEALGLGA